MPNNSLDLASFIAAVFTLFVTPQLAHFLGVYSAIFVGAVLGAGFALIRAPEMSRWKAAGYITLMAGAALITTVGIAEVINRWLKLDTINPLLAPLALIIAAVGHDWARVARGAWASGRRVFEGRYGAPPQGHYGGYRAPTNYQAPKPPTNPEDADD